MTTRSNASCSGFNTLTLFVYIHSFFIMKPLFYTFLEILFLPGALAWAQPTPKETIPICSIWSPAWAFTKTTIAILGLQEQFNCNTAFSKKRKPLLNMNVLREPSITFFYFLFNILFTVYARLHFGSKNSSIWIICSLWRYHTKDIHLRF